MLPQFPEFKKIDLTDKADVERHTNRYEPYSDFNFTCLRMWDTLEKRMISELNGNLVVLFTDYMTDEPFLSFLGTNNCDATARTLIDYCGKNNLPVTLRLIPEVSAQGLSHSEFMIVESRGDFDYIWSVQKIALLEGKKFYERRRLANKFWRENPSARLEFINLNDIEVQKQILETISKWENNKIAAKKDYHIAHELSATKRLFRSDCLNSLISMALYSGDQMLGYAIGEKLNHGYSIGHFLRGLVANIGVTEAMMQSIMKLLDSFHIEYWNAESDLEDEGMRNNKLSWRPVKFLKRYNVQLI